MVDRMLVPHWLADRLESRCVPQTRRAVLAGRGNARTIRTKCRIHDFILVPHRLADWSTGRCIPQARCLIRAGRENAPAIRAEHRDVNLCLLAQHERGHRVAISPAIHDRAPQMPRGRGALRIESERAPEIRDALAPRAFAKEPLRRRLIPAARAALLFFGLALGQLLGGSARVSMAESNRDCENGKSYSIHIMKRT